jgi:HD-like signal output (HDOD) protein
MLLTPKDTSDPMLTTLKEILRSMEDLPLVSEVAAKLLRRLGHANTSIGDLARLVSQDQALSSHVMKIANSSFYRRRGQVNTLEGALLLLGENALKELAIDTSLRSFRAANGAVEKALQSQSRQLALAARRVAQATAGVDPDEAFLAGMFCHVGRLVMHRRDPETFQQVLALSQKDEARVLDIERGLFAFSHEMIGAVLLELWNFSPLLVAAVLHHHDFAEVSELSDQVRQLAATLALAKSLCRSPSGRSSNSPELAPARALLCLDQNQLDTLQQDIANLCALPLG